jgi:hypothetical protein
MEREFVSRVLKLHLSEHQVFATPIVLGGPPNLDRVKQELKRLLPSFDRVTTFYDYYGFNRRAGLNWEQRRYAIHEFAPESERFRIIPYVQLHEFEALVFAEPTLVAGELGDTPQLRLSFNRSCMTVVSLS